jgi:type IV secretory pathway VirB2 component (pilin)
MDLTIPYTFYPLALPHWIAWTLFLLAMLGGVAVGMARGRGRHAFRGLLSGVFGAIGLLAATMIASMVITFFVHDQ